MSAEIIARIPPWIVCRCPQGTYYNNEQTGETTWEAPPAVRAATAQPQGSAPSPERDPAMMQAMMYQQQMQQMQQMQQQQQMQQMQQQPQAAMYQMHIQQMFMQQQQQQAAAYAQMGQGCPAGRGASPFLGAPGSVDAGHGGLGASGSSILGGLCGGGGGGDGCKGGGGGQSGGGKRMTGHLKKFIEDKGFGFIECSDSGEGDIFVHFSQVTNGGKEDMVVGAEMNFEMGQDPRSGKMRATNVMISGK